MENSLIGHFFKFCLSNAMIHDYCYESCQLYDSYFDRSFFTIRCAICSIDAGKVCNRCAAPQGNELNFDNLELASQGYSHEYNDLE